MFCLFSNFKPEMCAAEFGIWWNSTPDVYGGSRN